MECCPSGELDLRLRRRLRPLASLDDVLLARPRGADHLPKRLAQRVVFPRQVALAEADRAQMNDRGEVEGMQLAVAAAGVEDLAHGFAFFESVTPGITGS
jgi:hypothetical protein